jgi:hypothetical protein
MKQNGIVEGLMEVKSRIRECTFEVLIDGHGVAAGFASVERAWGHALQILSQFPEARRIDIQMKFGKSQ